MAQSLGSKTPYAPQQSSARYEAVPAGFAPDAIQLVARHGSRGLTKPGADLAALQLWQQAEAQDALTPLGRRFGVDLRSLIEAQQAIGYGNLSRAGVIEHQQLAQRMVARLPALFVLPVQVEVSSSGVDRAVDSSHSFVDALRLAAPLTRVPEHWGADRFTLYFHRLSEAQDGAAATTPERQATLRRSLGYQAWLRGPELAALQVRLDTDPALPPAARATLTALLVPTFVERIERGEISVGNKPLDLLAAAILINDLRGTAADLYLELGRDFQAYVPQDAAAVFEQHDDAEDFYRKGPGLIETGPVSYEVATQLLDEMWSGVASPGASVVLRFAHAEIIAPLVSAIGVAGVHQPLPRAMTYSSVTNGWRAARVIPMAANVQWEIWRNGEGERLLRMLLNEREADFKPACDGARLRPGSHFYRVVPLLACHGAAANGSARGDPPNR